MVSINSNYSSFVPQNYFKSSTNIPSEENNENKVAKKTNVDEKASDVCINSNIYSAESNYNNFNSVQEVSSFLQTADMALSDIADAVHELRCIAESAVNQENDNNQQELAERMDVIQKDISAKLQTTFNGTKVFADADNVNYSEYKTESDLLSEGYEIAEIDKVSGKLTNKCNSIIINSAEQFAALTNTSELFDKNFALTTDIDLSDVCNEQTDSWNPIGNNSTKFSGVFDGNGHTVRNLFARGSEGQGLFGETEGANIKNLRLENSDIVVDGNVAGTLVARQDGGEIENCFAGGTITGNTYIGGLVGISYGKIEGCESNCIVKAQFCVGGCAGFIAAGSVTNTLAAGDVQGNDFVGGIAGITNGALSNVVVATNITTTGEHVGAVVGENSGSVHNVVFNNENGLNNILDIQEPVTDDLSGIPDVSNWNTDIWDFSQSTPALKNIPSQDGCIKLDIIVNDSETSLYYDSKISLNLSENDISTENEVQKTIINMDKSIHEVELKQKELGGLIKKVENTFDADVNSYIPDVNMISIRNFQEAESQSATLRQDIINNLPASISITTANLNKDVVYNLV